MRALAEVVADLQAVFDRTPNPDMRVLEDETERAWNFEAERAVTRRLIFLGADKPEFNGGTYVLSFLGIRVSRTWGPDLLGAKWLEKAKAKIAEGGK